MRQIVAAALFVVAPITANGADIAGSKDHPIVSRYAGSEIIKYEAKDFDGYILPTSPSASRKEGPRQTRAIEGRVTRIHYQAPATRSALEVFRNYEQALRAAGFEVLFQCQDQQCGPLSHAVLTKSFAGLSFLHHNEKDQKFLAAKLARPEGEVHVALYAVRAYNVGGKNKDRVFTQLDVIESKAMQAGQVQVDADAMAREIAAKGRVALYGIYFDSGKTDIKPESRPALEQIGKLLKKNGSLKLLVVGHTDSAGDFDYNLELSRQRARSVVAALTGQYGIAAARLKSFGAGYATPVATNRAEAGRSQNRRVELVELP